MTDPRSNAHSPEKPTQPGLRARLKGLRDDTGSSLVELGILSCLLGVPLLVGTSEMASVVYSSIEVSNAAHAGALYGMQSISYAADTLGIIAAAQAEATDFGLLLTTVPTTYFVCSTSVAGTQYATQSAATSACTGTGNRGIQFVKVTTSVTVTPPVHAPGLAGTFTLNGSSIMEVEQ